MLFVLFFLRVMGLMYNVTICCKPQRENHGKSNLEGMIYAGGGLHEFTLERGSMAIWDRSRHIGQLFEERQYA
jgi:hypothetical protein